MLWEGWTGTGVGQEPVPSHQLCHTLCVCSWTPIPHLSVLAMPPSGLSQAVPGLAAPWGPSAVGTNHVVGTIPETPLDTVCFIQLIDLAR